MVVIPLKSSIVEMPNAAVFLLPLARLHFFWSIIIRLWNPKESFFFLLHQLIYIPIDVNYLACDKHLAVSSWACIAFSAILDT